RSYGHVLSDIAGARFLITKSLLDSAIKDRYIEAQRIMNLFSKPTPGLGAVGPSAATVTAAGGVTPIIVAKDFVPPAKPALSGRLVVADLQPLHAAFPNLGDRYAGHHSDIYHDEIYRLIAGFLF